MAELVADQAVSLFLSVALASFLVTIVLFARRIVESMCVLARVNTLGSMQR